MILSHHLYMGLKKAVCILLISNLGARPHNETDCQQSAESYSLLRAYCQYSFTAKANFFQSKGFHCFHELIYPAQVVFCQNTHWKCSVTLLSPFPDPLECSEVHVNEQVKIQQITSICSGVRVI